MGNSRRREARFRLSLSVLGAMALLIGLLAATPAAGQEPDPDPGISHAHMNVWNSVMGAETYGYGFEVFIDAIGEFGATALSDVTVSVGGFPLTLGFVEVAGPDEAGWHLVVGGQYPYPTTPNLGDYQVAVTDGADVEWTFDIGTLEDIPKDAPHMVFPTHLTLTTERTPTVSWEPFASDYLGSAVPAAVYELNLAPSDDEWFSFVYPIDPGTTSILYDYPRHPDGDQLPPEGLEPGVYNVTVHSGHDVAPGFGFEHHRNLQFVVYDPDGGFVTGGGWIDSPEGAYDTDPELSGRATFGFVSKYQRGATTPTGATEFQFRVADLNFHTNTYEWLVIAGGKAKYKGTGTINGTGAYRFMLTACDVAVAGNCHGEDSDTFRIRIWSDDGWIYDNQPESPEHSGDGTVLGGGSIVIHSG